ncbi:hypothetical protein [Streptomyces iconiensis]|uniref:Secreted protein n=1 Tax=Streptomyces iconiensis TaxID=1384038 RepID=A0ABT6ZS22_9ACTN|nr:hypothetical protein [Streptomyces iconiensis]MDJ1131869.1 hypothetical protein [Streptomyces iconiensis]
MLTIVLIVIAVLVVAGAVAYTMRSRSGGLGGRGLRRRFGPEYDRAVERHNGDAKAAERELGERVRRHGALRERPLPPGVRERYVAQWSGLQERFVESPYEAIAEAESLLVQLAQDRGYPGGEQPFEERFDALSVHHGPHVRGYLRLHAAAAARSNTEEMREAVMEARGLFDALTTARSDPAREGVHSPDEHAGRHGRSRMPWTQRRNALKGP